MEIHEDVQLGSAVQAGSGDVVSFLQEFTSSVRSLAVWCLGTDKYRQLGALLVSGQ
jgi:hypothetical protein